MTTLYKTTVIITTYAKHHQYLNKAIQSVDYPHDVLVINNSPDTPIADDQTIKVINLDTEVEAGELRNIGVRHCKTDTFMFLDGDDWLLPNVPDKFLARFNAYKVANSKDCVVYGRSLIHGGTGQVFNFKPQYRGRNLSKSELQTAQPNKSNLPYCILTSKTLYWAIGGNDPNMTTWEDLYFAKKLYCYGIPAEMVDVIAYYYYWSDVGRRALGNTLGATASDFIYNELKDYYRGAKITAFKETEMACGKCGGNRAPTINMDKTIVLPQLESNEELYIRYTGGYPTYTYKGDDGTDYRFHRNTRSTKKVVKTVQNPVTEISFVAAAKAITLRVQNYGYMFHAEKKVLLPSPAAVDAVPTTAKPIVKNPVQPPVVVVVEQPNIKKFSLKKLKALVVSEPITRPQYREWLKQELNNKPRKSMVTFLETLV